MPNTSLQSRWVDRLYHRKPVIFLFSVDFSGKEESDDGDPDLEVSLEERARFVLCLGGVGGADDLGVPLPPLDCFFFAVLGSLVLFEKDTASSASESHSLAELSSANTIPLRE